MNRKHMLMVFVVLALMASSLFATDSRMSALGHPFGYIRDDSDIRSFPGAVNRYQNKLIGELYTSGSSSDWTLGAILPIKDFTWSVYLNTSTGIDVSSYFPNNVNYYNTGDLDLSRKVQFYFGGMQSFGVGFGMAMDSKKMDRNDNPNKYSEASATYIDLSAGMSTDMMDVGAKLNIANASVKNDFDDFKNKFSDFGMQGSARYFVMDDDDLAILAIGNVALKSNKTDVDVSSSRKVTMEEGYFMGDLGAGVNYKMGDKNTVIFGVKPLRIASISEKNSYSDVDGADNYSYSYLYVPEYNLALESQIFPWLTGRLGARQNYVFYSEEDDPTGAWDTNSGHEEELDSWYNSSFNMNIGLGFKFGKFCIDTVLSKSFLHDGPYFIGGNSNGLASQISVKYNH